MTGFRHHPACLCGCQRVEGLPGTPLHGLDSDYGDYGLADMVVYAFPNASGGAPRLVAYDFDEIPEAA